MKQLIVVCALCVLLLTGCKWVDYDVVCFFGGEPVYVSTVHPNGILVKEWTESESGVAVILPAESCIWREHIEKSKPE